MARLEHSSPFLVCVGLRSLALATVVVGETCWYFYVFGAYHSPRLVCLDVFKCFLFLHIFLDHQQVQESCFFGISAGQTPNGSTAPTQAALGFEACSFQWRGRFDPAFRKIAPYQLSKRLSLGF